MLEATSEANNRNALSLGVNLYKKSMDKVLGGTDAHSGQFVKQQELQVRIFDELPAY